MSGSTTWRAIRLVHPFPSLINSLLVLGIALLAGGGAARAIALAAAMLLLQFCIGAVNDFVDVDLDARSKPWKPIASGLVGRRTVLVVALVSGGGALLVAASFGPVVVGLVAAMLACGLVYDVFLKPTAWAWICFAVAFPLLPIYAWYGATGAVPPRLELLVPVAALAGPLIQLSNGLSDLDTDREAGLVTLAVRLGRRRSLAVIGILVVVVQLAGWLTLAPTGSLLLTAACAASSFLAAVGVVLSASPGRERRELGWMVQASALALLGLGWLGAAVSQ